MFDRIRILQNIMILSDSDLDADPQHYFKLYKKKPESNTYSWLTFLAAGASTEYALKRLGRKYAPKLLGQVPVPSMQRSCCGAYSVNAEAASAYTQ